VSLAIAEARKLCKSLSEVAARCSYAIYLAHKQKAWVRSDLIDLGTSRTSSKLNDCLQAPQRRPRGDTVRTQH